MGVFFDKSLNSISCFMYIYIYMFYFPVLQYAFMGVEWIHGVHFYLLLFYLDL